MQIKEQKQRQRQRQQQQNRLGLVDEIMIKKFILKNTCIKSSRY